MSEASSKTSHIKNSINQINNKVLVSLNSCLIQAVLIEPWPKLKVITRVFFLNYPVIFCDVILCIARHSRYQPKQYLELVL